MLVNEIILYYDARSKKTSNKNYINNIDKKVESRNRPGVAQRVPGDLGFQISMTFGT
jgi:hypothetical protein